MSRPKKGSPEYQRYSRIGYKIKNNKVGGKVKLPYFDKNIFSYTGWFGNLYGPEGSSIGSLSLVFVPWDLYEVDAVRARKLRILCYLHFPFPPRGESEVPSKRHQLRVVIALASSVGFGIVFAKVKELELEAVWWIVFAETEHHL
ncbi:hypothetical protein Tco_1282736 [Tanacetum coccineum]